MSEAMTLSLVMAVQELVDARDYTRALEVLKDNEPDADRTLSAAERLTLDILTAECFAFRAKPKEAASICRRAMRTLQGGHEHALYARACFVTAVAKHYLGDIDDTDGPRKKRRQI